MWKKFLRDYLTFTRWERNGLVILMLLVLIIIFFPSLASLFHRHDDPDFSSFRNEVDSFEKRIDEAKAKKNSIDSSQVSFAELDHSNSPGEKKNATIVLFLFDPNTISPEEWRELGLSEKMIHTIMNYRSKGGKFFKKEDLKRIYGLSSEEYDRLEPYIQITSDHAKETPKVQVASLTTETKIAVPKKSLIDLNAADSSQLVSLNGIGAVLSSRIIKLRNKLGGFYGVDQLRDVYGLSPETFDQIKDQLMVNSSSVKKININSVTLDELKLHPYFKNPIASTLINYRGQHGAFHSFDELKNIDVISDELFQKMLPYLEL